MPRVYVRKKQSLYQPDELKKVLQLIRDEQISVKEASKQYHIPVPTLYSRLSGVRGDGKPGVKSILSKEEEEFLIHVIHKFQDWQQPLSQPDLIHIARDFMIELQKKNIDEHSCLRDWCYSFRERWKDEIKTAVTYNLESIRSTSCTHVVVEKWFTHLEKVFSRLNLFDRPEALYNVDECGFSDSAGRRHVIIKRGSKYATCSQGGSGKSYTTVLMCSSASGKFLPPYIVYKAQKLYDAWIPKNTYPGTRYNATESGWSEEPVFFDWLCKQFVPSVKMVKKPVLLLMDGHKSHLSTRIIRIAMDNGIHIECLPPHSTTILQPLDVLTLSKVKQSWKKLLYDFFKKTNSQPITKQRFALLISELFKRHLLPAHCAGGFSKAGIYPFDRRAISKEKLLQPATTLTVDTAIQQSSTSDDLNDSTFSTNSIPRLRRSSSCPNISNIASITSKNDLSTIVNVDPNPSSITSSLVPMDISLNNLDNEMMATANNTSTTSIVPLSTAHTNIPGCSSEALNLLYSQANEPKLSESIFSGLPSSFVDVPLNKDYSSDRSAQENSLNNKHEENAGGSVNSQSLPSPTSSALNAITNVINNFMESPIIETNKRRKLIDRPYGESITSVDAYIKIQQQEEKSRKRSYRGSNIKEKKTSTRQPRTTRNQKKKTSVDENANPNPINHGTNVLNNHQFPSNCPPLHANPQCNIWYAPPAPTSFPSYNSNFNSNTSQPYDMHQHQSQPNGFKTNSQACFKCNNLIYFNFGQFFQCISCHRFCCTTCMTNFSPPNSYYQCEYCSLNVALQLTQSQQC